MPVCALHLVQLLDASTGGIDAFLQTLFSAVSSSGNGAEFGVLTVSKVQSPIIRPTLIDNNQLNDTPWTLLVVATGTSCHVFPSSLKSSIKAHYSVIAGIPNKIVSNYDKISEHFNSKSSSAPLLEIKLDDKGDVIPPPKKGSAAGTLRDDGQDLSLSPALLSLAKTLNHEVKHKGPVSMLNFLHFHEGQEAVESYHEYGRRFVNVAGKRGGNAKLVSVVVNPLKESLKDSRGERKEKGQWWNEATLVHYPSINHFIDMSVDDEYQFINKEYRLGAIKDTALICTTEIDLKSYRGGSGGGKAKL